jgi:hypothetical protein
LRIIVPKWDYRNELPFANLLLVGLALLPRFARFFLTWLENFQAVVL